MSENNLNDDSCLNTDLLLLPEQFNSTTFVRVDEHYTLHPIAADALMLMREEAKMEGIHIDIVSAFRSIDQQLSIWNAKWRGERPLYHRNGHNLDPASLSDSEKLHAILTFSALPGASRHHWGTDLDVYDQAAVNAQNHHFELVASEYQADGPCALMSGWLKRNARIFGFEFPYAEDKGGIAAEPWHISHQTTAQVAAQSLSLENLQHLINGLDIEGKAVILDNIESLYHRYVLNLGIN